MTRLRGGARHLQRNARPAAGARHPAPRRRRRRGVR